MDGTYRIGQIAVNGFHGSLAGAGKERTAITTMPDLPCPGTWPILLQFTEGDVRVADLTFAITDPHPCQEWLNPVDDPGLWYPRHDLAVIVAIGGQPLDCVARLDHPATVYARFVVRGRRLPRTDRPGRPRLFGVSPVPLGISGGVEIDHCRCIGRYRPLGGVHSVANCSFENTLRHHHLGPQGTSVLIGGSGAKATALRMSCTGCGRLTTTPRRSSSRTMRSWMWLQYGTRFLACRTKTVSPSYDWPDLLTVPDPSEHA